MTQVLVLHQLRFDLLAMRRNRRAQFFVLALPLLLLVTFAGLLGTDAVEVAGQPVAANRASVPGIMGLAVLTSAFAALTQAVVAQRESGILKRRRATPVPAAVLVISRALTATISSLAACALLVFAARALYGIEAPAGGLGALALAVIAGSLCFACCGYAVAATVTNAESAQPLLQVVMLPLQMISGIYFPASQLPDWLQHVADAFPLVHLTDALQHAWLASGPEIAWGDLGVLALWAAGAAYVAARRFRWLPRF
jgi:ABC-2 type transport system permease protein